MSTIASVNVDHLLGLEVGTSTIVSELARGGMSIIFVAFQRSLKRKIAVKILPKQFLTPKTAELFQQEAESAAILYHPNIIPVYEVGETDEFLFFTMQLIEGDTLAQLIKKTKKNIIPSKRILPVKTTIDMMVQVLDALNYAHEQQIIHRDIKPGNILIVNDGKRPVVTDFGIAKVLRGADDTKPVIQGTPVYMAPEQVINKDISGKADIYASGIMMFQMLAETLPFYNVKSTMELLKLKVKNKNGVFTTLPSMMNPKLHGDMDLIIKKATERNPEKRFNCCNEFADALKQYKKNHIMD